MVGGLVEGKVVVVVVVIVVMVCGCSGESVVCVKRLCGLLCCCGFAVAVLSPTAVVLLGGKVAVVVVPCRW